MCLAATGFCFQLRNRFTHAFPLNLIMLPFTVTESVLALIVHFA
jgi:hypothetical protein